MGLKCALREAADASKGRKFLAPFLLAEWEDVVDAWQLDSWESYRDVVRLGRKTRLPEKQRASLWTIFETFETLCEIEAKSLFRRCTRTRVQAKRKRASAIRIRRRRRGAGPQRRAATLPCSTWRHAPERSFLCRRSGSTYLPAAVLVEGARRRCLWSVFRLKINYRTSHQIRSQADRLLDPELSDVDGILEKRSGTVSTFNGDPPEVVIVRSKEEEIEIKPRGCGAARAKALFRMRSAFSFALMRTRPSPRCSGTRGSPVNVLDERVETASGRVRSARCILQKDLSFALSLLSLATTKSFRFKRIESVGDDSDLAEVYATERHLLYVASTRARDHLLVSRGCRPPFPFDDLRQTSEPPRGGACDRLKRYIASSQRHELHANP